MNDKILNALKTKYKSLGLSEKALEGFANIIAKTITDEADIETAISGVEPMLKAIQSDTDKLRGENTTLRSQLEAAKKTETNPTEPPKEDKTGDGDKMPAWAKQMFEKFDGVEKKLNTIEADKVTVSRKSRLDEKLKDAPDTLKNMVAKNFGKMKFDSDNDFDEYLTDVSRRNL